MYARVVTLYIKPDKVNDMNTLFQDTLLPLMKGQSGFKGIFVLNNPGEDKEVCMTLWEKLVDMETFNTHYLDLVDEITPHLTEAPEVEIFHVTIPEDAEPPGIIAWSESSLGIRIQDPFDHEPALEFLK